MIGPVRLALCCALLAVCSPFAFADGLSITGYVNFTPSSLSFAPPFATSSNTGFFSDFNGGTVNYLLGTVAYTNGIPATEEAFTVTDTSGNVLAFYDEVNSPTQYMNGSGNLAVTLDETGYYTLNGGQNVAGTFDLGFDGTSPTGSSSNVEFFGTGALLGPAPVFPTPVPSITAVTPEPVSFLLMGTGFLGLAGLVRSRRRSPDSN